MEMIDGRLSEEQRLMRRSCRAFIVESVTPFIRATWKPEWIMEPEARRPRRNDLQQPITPFPTVEQSVERFEHREDGSAATR